MPCETGYAAESSARSIPAEKANHSISLQIATQRSEAEANAVGRIAIWGLPPAGGRSKTNVPTPGIAQVASVDEVRWGAGWGGTGIVELQPQTHGLGGESVWLSARWQQVVSVAQASSLR
jgi:hypothetical protein